MKPNPFRVFRVFRGHLLREVIASLLCYGMLLQSTMAAAPGWWSTQGVLIPNKPADDYAALNQGQLKLLASKAWLQMELALPGGAGPQLTQMLSGWRLVQPQTDDYGVVNAGQLKHAARPFYQRLKDAGLLTLPAWCSPQAGTDDFAVVNVGQAQMIFSFAIPQALSHAPQRLSGNGMAGLEGVALPAGYPWGSGRPPLVAATGLAPPGVLPSSTAEVSTTPSSAADWSKVPGPAAGLTVESKWAGGSVYKGAKYRLNEDGTYSRDGWESSGAAFALPGDDYQNNLASAGALTSALQSLSTLPAGTEPPDELAASSWTTSGGFGATSLPFLSSLSSGYWKSLAPEDTDDAGEVVGESWYGQQTQFRVSGGGATAAQPRQAWWKIDRTLHEQGQPGSISHTVEFVPYTIAATREQAGVMSVASQHWGVSEQYEHVSFGLILPELLQVNDGDADGDDVPDFADGLGVAEALPEDEPERPQTADLPTFDVAPPCPILMHGCGSPTPPRTRRLSS